MTQARRATTLLLLFLLTPMLGLAAAPTIEVLRYGTYTARTDKLMRPEGSVDSVLLVDRLELTEQTQQVTARPGTIIGLDYRVRGAGLGGSVPIDVEVAHPPMTVPGKGEPATRALWRMYPDPDTEVHAGWMFKASWELVPGTYVFRLRHQGRTLASQAFQVSLPPAAPAAKSDSIRPSSSQIPAEPLTTRVTVTPSAPSPTPPLIADLPDTIATVYCVQVAAHRKRELARNHMAELTSQGHPACTVELIGNGGRPWYIVVLIPAHSSEPQARAHMQAYTKATREDALVKRIDVELLRERVISE